MCGNGKTARDCNTPQINQFKMKALTLSKEQSNKLLEMCRTLFPGELWGFGGFYSTEVGADYTGLDYLDVTHINHKILNKQCDGFVDNISDTQQFFTADYPVDEETGEYDYSKPTVIAGQDFDQIYVEGIHWFEFCLTHLATCLYNKGDYNKRYITITAFRGYICQEAEHPVDYLYQEFKKLKL